MKLEGSSDTWINLELVKELDRRRRRLVLVSSWGWDKEQPEGLSRAVIADEMSFRHHAAAKTQWGRTGPGRACGSMLRSLRRLPAGDAGSRERHDRT